MAPEALRRGFAPLPVCFRIFYLKTAMLSMTARETLDAMYLEKDRLRVTWRTRAGCVQSKLSRDGATLRAVLASVRGRYPSL